MVPESPAEESKKCEVPNIRREWTLEYELQKNKYLKVDAVNALRVFCLSLPQVNLTTVATELLVALLHCSDYDLDRAQTVATKYFDIRTSAPDVFANRDLEGDAGAALETGYFSALPRRTPEGYQVVFQSLRNTDTSIFNFASYLKTNFLLIDTCIHEDPSIPGYIFLLDFSKFGLGHFKTWSVFLSMRVTKYTQEGIPLKLKQIHFINSSPYVQKITRLIKPFMNQHLWNMLQFHTPNEIERFYEFVPKDCLPKDYGGDLPDLETLRKDDIELLRRVQPQVDNIST